MRTQAITPLERATFTALALIIIGYLIRSQAFLFFAMLTAATFLVAWMWPRFALRRLRYERIFSEKRAFVGETITVTLQVTNRKRLPLPRLRIDDYCSEELCFTDVKPEGSHIPGLVMIRQQLALSWFDQVTRTYHIDCRQRGLYVFPQLRIETGDPFNLFRVTTETRQENRFIIYPEVKPVTGLRLPSKEFFGSRAIKHHLFNDPILVRGVRPYQPQDGQRHIHWKATARTGSLQTKLLEPATTPSLMLFVNIATFSKRWQGLDPVLLERVVSVSASLCNYAIGQKLMVGLSANGTYHKSDQPLRVLPSRSPKQLTQLLEALAGIEGFAGSEFDAFLLHESTRLPWGATLIIITAVITPALEAVILRLRHAGRKMILLSLADEPPAWVAGIDIYHLPGREIEAAYDFNAVTLSPAAATQ